MLLLRRRRNNLTHAPKLWLSLLRCTKTAVQTDTGIWFNMLHTHTTIHHVHTSAWDRCSLLTVYFLSLIFDSKCSSPFHSLKDSIMYNTTICYGSQSINFNVFPLPHNLVSHAWKVPMHAIVKLKVFPAVMYNFILVLKSWYMRQLFWLAHRMSYVYLCIIIVVFPQ